MVVITNEEKLQMCIDFAVHLPAIRELLHLSQTEFGERIGSSKSRVGLIETGKFIMTWSQLTSVLFLCLCNKVTKDYLYVHQLMSPRFLQFMQCKNEFFPPDINIIAEPMHVDAYQSTVGDYIKEILSSNS